MNNITILVVDDESRMRKLIKDFLAVKGYKILEAADGEKALEVFETEKDKISLILLDVMMPKLDGWSVLRQIRQTSKVPIILLTARGEEQDELFGFELGVDEYISIMLRKSRGMVEPHMDFMRAMFLGLTSGMMPGMMGTVTPPRRASLTRR